MTRSDAPVCVVTGANSGVGRAACELLATWGATVVMVCRNRARGEKARRGIQRASGNAAIALEIADLSSLDQTRRLADALRSRYDRIDALINNAGVYRVRREITADGLEMTLAVNHLAHFLLTLRLLDSLEATSGTVVNVSSEAHRSARLDRLPLQAILGGEGRYRGYVAYADSKLAVVLFTFELVRRLDPRSAITANAVHPGVLATRIWNQNADPASLFMRALKPFLGHPHRGGAAVTRLVTQPTLRGATGKYFNQFMEMPASATAYDPHIARELWELSSELTGAGLA